LLSIIIQYFLIDEFQEEAQSKGVKQVCGVIIPKSASCPSVTRRTVELADTDPSGELVA
jgi:hypothetical protein